MLSRVIAKNVGDVFFETQCTVVSDKTFDNYCIENCRLMPVLSSENVSITSEIMALIVVCRHSLPTHSQPQSCINKRLLCSSLASTLRNPILPKAVSKRKYVGLDDPHFDEDVEKKRPNAGEEYDPDGDYIYDARKYFNPDKYREIIAHQEEKKKKQQKKFYYKPFHSHKRHYHNKYQYITDSGYSSVNYDWVGIERLSSVASSLSDSEYPIDDVDKLQHSDSHPSSCHKKVKKKSKHSRHGSHVRESSHKHAKRKKSDVDDKKHRKKKKKKKRKQKKSGDERSMPLCHGDDDCMSVDKHRSKLKHSKRRSRHRSKLSSCQEPPTKVSKVLNCDHSYNKLQSPDLPDLLITPKSSMSSSVSPVSSCERQTAVSPCSPNSVYYQL